MITFNIRACNGNYYRGHKPSNKYGNCWGDEVDATVFTIEQARELVAVWPGYLGIVISVNSDEPITDDVFRRELFCSKGGSWYDELPDQKDQMTNVVCECYSSNCGEVIGMLQEKLEDIKRIPNSVIIVEGCKQGAEDTDVLIAKEMGYSVYREE